MKISVIVPFYSADNEDGLQRLAVWIFIRSLWEAQKVELIQGRDPLAGSRPFSVSRALNEGAQRATGDFLLLMGADHMPDLWVLANIPEKLSQASWWRPYRKISYLTKEQTRALLIDLQPAEAPEPELAGCFGVLALTRAAWTAVSGMDEEFQGWGYEDTDLVNRLDKYEPEREDWVSHPLIELYHDVTNRDLEGANKALYDSKRGVGSSG